MSPPTLAAGSSQPERVKAPPSQVNEAGSRRRWISAERLNGVVRCPPLEQVGVPAVGDDHERQRVRGAGDPVHHVVVRLVGQVDLQQADHLSAVGDRCQHGPRAVAGDDLGGLLPEGAFVGPAVEGEDLGVLLAVAPAGTAAGRLVGQPDQRTAAEVGDQQRDAERVQRRGDDAGDGLDRLHRGGVLGRLQHPGQHGLLAVLHAPSIFSARGCRLTSGRSRPEGRERPMVPYCI
ncbi:hypothetical protein ABIH81_05125 [Micromonospora sp. HUAS YX12]|uniref:Uncharacterized protein n=1 Tax=Micromonospora sp. HUAS YX12 TaxID=3156396 RepID=A0AAU7R4H6_9ACTN